MTRTQRNWEAHRPVLESAARQAGVEPDLLIGIAGLESRFDAGARPVSSNPALNRVTQYDGTKAMSSAYGLGQFLDSTWHDVIRRHGARHGVDNADRLTRAEANAPALREDVVLQAAMLAEFTRENVERSRRYGATDPASAVYAMHNLGAGDAGRFLTAARERPDSPVREVLSSSVIANNPSLYGTGDRSIREALAAMSREMGRFSGHAREVELGLPSGQLTAGSPGAAPATANGRLAIGARGEPVARLQTHLSELGYTGRDGRPLVADQHFGPNTQAAVAQFQQDRGLTVDGVAGANILAAIHDARAAGAPSPSLSCRPEAQPTPPPPRHGFLEALLTAARNADPEEMRSALAHLARSPAGQSFSPPQSPPAHGASGPETQTLEQGVDPGR